MKIDYFVGTNIDKKKPLSVLEAIQFCKKNELDKVSFPQFFLSGNVQKRYFNALNASGIRYIPSIFMLSHFEDRPVFVSFYYNKNLPEEIIEFVKENSSKLLNNIYRLEQDLRKYSIYFQASYFDKSKYPPSPFLIANTILKSQENILSGNVYRFYAGIEASEPLLNFVKWLFSLKFSSLSYMVDPIGSFKTIGFFRYGKLIFHTINLSATEIDAILEKNIFSGVLIESSNLKDKKYIEYFAKKNISILPTTYYFGENYNRIINIGFEYTYDSSDLPIALL